MLQGAPTSKHLSRIYYELSQAGAHCSGEKLPWPYHPKNLEERFVLAAEMTRYDPRLLGILIEFLLKHWEKISPQLIRKNYPKMETPQTIAVVAEFAKEATKEKEIFYFMEYLQKGLKPVPFQLYFKDLYTPGGELTQKAIEKAVFQFKKWGFFARETPTIDVYRKKTVGRMDRDSRLNVLRKLLLSKKEVRISDYLKVMAHCISRQQALKDLQAIARLRRGSKGRGSVWVLR